ATTPGDVLQRAAGFGLGVDRATDADPAALCEHLGRVVAHVRRGHPFLQVIETRRLMAHSKGDDNRPEGLVRGLWRADPLARLLEDEGQARRGRAAEAAVAELAREVAARPALGYVETPALPPLRERLASAELHADAAADRAPGRVAEELNGAL